MLPDRDAQTHYTRFKCDFVLSNSALNYFRFITLVGELTSVVFLEPYSKDNECKMFLVERFKSKEAKPSPPHNQSISYNLPKTMRQNSPLQYQTKWLVNTGKFSPTRLEGTRLGKAVP